MFWSVSALTATNKTGSSLVPAPLGKERKTGAEENSTSASSCSAAPPSKADAAVGPSSSKGKGKAKATLQKDLSSGQFQGKLPSPSMPTLQRAGLPDIASNFPSSEGGAGLGPSSMAQLDEFLGAQDFGSFDNFD